MKRSEMKKKIYDALIHQPYDKDWVEQILIVVEDAGMIPPHSNTVFQKNCRILQEPHGNEWDAE